MLWRAGDPQTRVICDGLLRLWPHVSRCIMKFDHWLEMVLLAPRGLPLPLPVLPEGALPLLLVQQSLPGLVVEYASLEGRGDVPSAPIVCFPLKPKPHECPDAWVRKHWR
jgi:hypothetical protein